MQDLDAIMDSRPEGNETNEQQQQRDDGRDERGRFAGQAREQAKQDAEAHQQQSDQQVTQTEQVDPIKPPPGFIPQQAFDARMAKAEEKWNGEVTNLRTQLDQAMRQLQQFQPRPQAEAPKPPPDFFENPDAAFQARLQEAISPLQQGQSSIVETFSRMIASDKHGEETVNKAYQDLQSRVNSNPAAMQATYLRIMQSQHPYGELVKWHKEQSALSTYGDDPEAWRNSERERIRAEILAEAQGGQPNGQQQTPQQQVPQNMPNNFAGSRNNGPRSTPGFSGPKPLSEIMGGR
jgi:hypothetical protein